MKRLLFIIGSAATLAFTSVNANAAGSDLDACILDITFQCVDDDDFWGCYNVGVELCENQSSSSIQGINKRTIDLIKTDARKRAQTILSKRKN